jgi:hypothetical protein
MESVQPNLIGWPYSHAAGVLMKGENLDPTEGRQKEKEAFSKPRNEASEGAISTSVT